MKRLGSGDIQRPSPEHDPPNHIEKIGKLDVRSAGTTQKEFCGRRRGIVLSNQRDLVGHVQGVDARFLLNQGVSEFAQ